MREGGHAKNMDSSPNLRQMENFPGHAHADGPSV